MPLPTKDEAFILLERHVTDDYQRHHARMAATALVGYSSRCVGDPALRFITGLLHDLDFQDHPETHPQEALRWVVAWDHPAGLIHAVEAHACGYHDYTTLPQTPLATALLATDELCGCSTPAGS